VSRLVFLGPPGAGKGTQAMELSKRLRVPHLSTGEMLRAAIRDGTPLGVEADTFVRAGRLVPDELVLRILTERFRADDVRAGFILDGYPRNRSQAETLAGITPVEHVVYFDIPERHLVDRLTQRRSCPSCGTVYNLLTQPPKADERCDREGAALIQRADDAPDAVRTRLRIYREQTAPLLVYYQENRLLRTIDAGGTPAEVSARLWAAIGP
jgi:adenylate kinase